MFVIVLVALLLSVAPAKAQISMAAPQVSVPQNGGGSSRSVINGQDSRIPTLVEQALRGQIGALTAGMAAQLAHTAAEGGICKEDMENQQKTIDDLQGQITELKKKCADRCN